MKLKSKDKITNGKNEMAHEYFEKKRNQDINTRHIKKLIQLFLPYQAFPSNIIAQSAHIPSSFSFTHIFSSHTHMSAHLPSFLPPFPPHPYPATHDTYSESLLLHPLMTAKHVVSSNPFQSFPSLDERKGGEMWMLICAGWLMGVGEGKARGW